MSRWRLPWKARVVETPATRIFDDAELAFQRADYTSALPLYVQCLSMFEETRWWEWALVARLRLGYVSFATEYPRTARAHYEHAIGLARRIYPEKYLGVALQEFAAVAEKLGDEALLRSLCEECLSLAKGDESPEWLAATYRRLGSMSADPANSQECLERALSLYNKHEDWEGVASLLLTMAHRCSMSERFQEAHRYLEQVIGLVDSTGLVKFIDLTKYELAGIAAVQGEYSVAARLCAELIESVDTAGSSGVLAGVNIILGVISPDRDAASSYFESALAMYRELDRSEGVAGALCCLGHLAEPDSDNAREREYLEECVSICLATGNQKTQALALANLGDIYRCSGNYGRAQELYRECARLTRGPGNERCIASLLESCACLATVLQDGGKSARLFGAARAIRERLGTPVNPRSMPELGNARNAAMGILGSASFEREFAEGAALSVPDALSLALS